MGCAAEYEATAMQPGVARLLCTHVLSLLRGGRPEDTGREQCVRPHRACSACWYGPGVLTLILIASLLGRVWSRARSNQVVTCRAGRGRCVWLGGLVGGGPPRYDVMTINWPRRGRTPLDWRSWQAGAVGALPDCTSHSAEPSTGGELSNTLTLLVKSFGRSVAYFTTACLRSSAALQARCTADKVKHSTRGAQTWNHCRRAGNGAVWQADRRPVGHEQQAGRLTLRAFLHLPQRL